jgi:hypothetical protein
MIYALVFIGVFLFALWYSVIKYRRKRRAIRENGMVTMAVVTDAQEAFERVSRDLDDRQRIQKVYRHLLQYQAPDMHTYHFKTSDPSWRLALGQQVEIVYRADKPEVAMLKREADSGGNTSLVIACVVTVILVFAAEIIFVIRGIFT